MSIVSPRKLRNGYPGDLAYVNHRPDAGIRQHIPLNRTEGRTIPFRVLVPPSPFTERGKERIRKASHFLSSCFLFGYGLFLLLLGFFHVPSAFSSHCLFSSSYFGIDYSWSRYSPIMDRKASCLKRRVPCCIYHSGKSL